MKNTKSELLKALEKLRKIDCNGYLTLPYQIENVADMDEQTALESLEEVKAALVFILN